MTEPIQIAALLAKEPELFDFAIARAERAAAIDRRALGLPPVAARSAHACGCDAVLHVVTEPDGTAWCPRCSPS